MEKATAESWSASARENERIAHLVLGRPRPAPTDLQKPRGMSRQEWKVRRAEIRARGTELSPGIEEAVRIRESWRGIAGTPETLERATRSHQGSLARLCRAGTISAEQLAAAEEIRAAVESIHADVAFPVASWEVRIDAGFRPEAAFFEQLGAVRHEMTYTAWRSAVAGPIAMILDMIVDDEGYSNAALRYGMHARRAKRLLIDALDLWWRIRGRVRKEVDSATLAAAQAGIFA